MKSIIDVLVERHNKVKEFLNEGGEVSLISNIDDEFRKVLVLSIGSFFESEITKAMHELAYKTQSERIANLIKAKAISRQYHTYFNWEGKNPNSFLALFGTTFKNAVSEEMQKNPSLHEGCRDFLKLGQRRNFLVHENFASAPMDRTLDEIQRMYKSALKFVAYLSDRIQNDQTIPPLHQ